jgi:PIN domain nuclease of toxin-antitoxin system
MITAVLDASALLALLLAEPGGEKVAEAPSAILRYQLST